jgi:hypothetical protein
MELRIFQNVPWVSTLGYGAASQNGSTFGAPGGYPELTAHVGA